jgi:hypothetical protein
MEGVEMKAPLTLTAAIALKEAANCIADARQICRKLNEHETDRQLRDCQDGLRPIAEAMHSRAQEEQR